MNCEDCDYTDIADWEQDKTTGKARPVYWCERYRKMCSSIGECQYKTESEDYKENEKKMTRLEENEMRIGKIIEVAERKPSGIYEEMMIFQLGAIVTILADISKSLAILADEAEGSEKE